MPHLSTALISPVLCVVSIALFVIMQRAYRASPNNTVVARGHRSRERVLGRWCRSGSPVIALVLRQRSRPLKGCRTTFRDTVAGMSSAISVRLDDDAERALRVLNACGMSTSDAIRSSLIESARRVRRSKALAEEVAVLEADGTDRAEMLAVAAFMESLRAAR